MSLDTEFEAGPFGHEIPVNVQFCSKLLSEELISTDHLEQLASACYEYVVSRKFSRANYYQVKREVVHQWESHQLTSQLGLSELDFDRLFNGLLTIVQCVRRNFANAKPSSYGEEIRTQCKLPREMFNVIYRQFYLDASFQVPKLQTTANLNRIATGNYLLQVRWRLDVVISDRLLSKVMEPVVLFELTYSNDPEGRSRQKCVFECRLRQFHRLRFTVALLLKEIAKLEANKMIQAH